MLLPVKTTCDFNCDHEELARVESITAEFAALAGLSDADLFALQIVVEELVTNVINYGGVPAGSPAAHVDLETSDGVLTIVIKDHGRPYNPLLRDDPDTSLPAEERPIGGLGVHFCKKLTDAQRYERCDGCNVLVLTKKLSS